MRCIIFVLLLCLPSTLWAGPKTPTEPPPANLAGSKEVETWLNSQVDKLGMARIDDDVELYYLINIGYLVPIPENICVDSRLEEKWRYVMPQVARFLLELQEEFSQTFGEACFMVNSAVRTVPRQIEVTIGSGTKKNGNDKKNLNAAAVTGPRASLHLTGATIDIGKLDPTWLSKSKMVQLKPRVIRWMRENLIKYEVDGIFDVTEEFGQAVFHVTVLPTKSEKTD